MNPNNYIDELRDVIRRLYDVESMHVQSVPVKEVFEGKTIWEGIVEVFDLVGHLKSTRVYAWSHETDNPKKPRRDVTVLHIAPIISPEAAVRAHIIQEYRLAQES